MDGVHKMPVLVERDDGDPTYRYIIPYYLTPDPESLREIRKSATLRQEAMLNLQKETRDKFFKEEAREALKWFRAADLLYKWVAGDKDARSPRTWPIDLVHYFDRTAELASEKRDNHDI